MEEHKFFLPMIAHVVLNKLRPPREIKKTLAELTEEDGRRIGRSLAVSLAANLTAEAGVEEWIGRNPALREFDDDQVWLRPMVVHVAKKLLKEASWGSKMRLFVGAGLSMVDLASDIAMVVTYMNEGQEGTARSLLAMICLCLLFQLWIVHAQRRASQRHGEGDADRVERNETGRGRDARSVGRRAEQAQCD